MTGKELLIAEIKKTAVQLAKEYGSNIKLEINVNPGYSSVKINITEYNK